MRLIDADALMDEAFKICTDCERRKGVKNGKYRIIYEIGEVPCRACSVDDMKATIEDAPTIDAVPVVRCKDCKRHNAKAENLYRCDLLNVWHDGDFFCANGERREQISAEFAKLMREGEIQVRWRE